MQDLYNSIKKPNLQITGMQTKGIGNIQKIVEENF
jgi:hypothetical protein